MRFALDGDERFELSTVEGGGWQLEVDGRRVHYCRDPLAALRYVSEELRETVPAQGVDRVVAALDRIDQTMAKITETMELHLASAELKRVLSARLGPSGSRREHVRHTSLALAGLGPDGEVELRSRPDARDIVARAKAVLEPWFETRGT